MRHTIKKWIALTFVASGGMMVIGVVGYLLFRAVIEEPLALLGAIFSFGVGIGAVYLLTHKWETGAPR